MFDVGQMLLDILTFHAGYDLLLFYVFMLASSPLLIEIGRRVGVLPVLAVSTGLFFWHYDNPYLHLWAIEKDFPLVRWQLIFVIGLVMGSKLKAYDALSAERKWQLFGVAVLAALGVDTLSALERTNVLFLPWWLTVTKLPLSPLEVLRYLSLAIAAGVSLDRAWHWFGNTTAQRVLAAVGVQSLMLWIAHVPIVANVAPLPWPVAMLLAWVGVWAFAVSGTKLTKFWNDRLPTMPRFAYVVPVIGSAVICVTLLRMQVPRTIETPLASSGFATDESAFFDGDSSGNLPIPIDDDTVYEVT